ncbi:MAG TPA: hypothetical protein VGY77_09445 [Gemmataceae bacterium]|nr:hypothetical protein [Gemmataceae bacterium]
MKKDRSSLNWCAGIQFILFSVLSRGDFPEQKSYPFAHLLLKFPHELKVSFPNAKNNRYGQDGYAKKEKFVHG